jgi:EAL domain-containing protein (putative c-di-GMP-specific phosphodiesterase class I)
VRDLLAEVLQPGGLSVLFQPIVEIMGRVVGLHGVECLLRGPEGTNLRRADVLFDYVRRKRGESLVDRACVETALRGAGKIPGAPRVSINVHASTLGRDRGFAAFLAEAAARFSIPPSRLTLEIVEHAPPWDGAGFQRALGDLRDMGVRTALDDIGLGQSNYKMILDCRPDYFKVDRYLVLGCSRDRYRRAILESIRQLALRFGGRVVAEGIDNGADLCTVASLGIDLVQGDLFSPAQPLACIVASGFLGRNPAAGPPSHRVH